MQAALAFVADQTTEIAGRLCCVMGIDRRNRKRIGYASIRLQRLVFKRCWQPTRSGQWHRKIGSGAISVFDLAKQRRDPGVECVKRLSMNHHRAHLIGGVVRFEEIGQVVIDVAAQRIEGANIEF